MLSVACPMDKFFFLIECLLKDRIFFSFSKWCFIRLAFFLIKFILPCQMTAIHQLKIAVMSVAFVGRSLFFTSLSASSMKPVDLGGGGDAFIDLVGVSLSNALLGMDANDPPKTLATMQLIGSIFSNVSSPVLDIYE